ncbi:ras GTPase-activating protein raskol-like [Artemia franciscana]|uniref:ras GTPase-activating protein raskol-like n=1 Tax=Artemia franciscana TaxID=6661 RepID=UPI0032D9C116
MAWPYRCTLMILYTGSNLFLSGASFNRYGLAIPILKINADEEQVRRVHNSLTIWILEAKGVAAKKRYFCTLCLDKTPYIRTASKTKTDICFWGENFEFSALPAVNTVYVHLYREVDKKRRKEKNSLIGTVAIAVSSITSRCLIEKWHPIIPHAGSGKEVPSLRIKCKFQVIDILPLACYSDFTEFLFNNYDWLCDLLEPSIGVKAKEDLATSLIALMHRYGRACNFLADLVASDIQKMDDKHLVFRGNSLATKATEAFMKLTGETYLRNCLAEVLGKLIDDTSTRDCEVDPLRVASQTSLMRQQANLRSAVGQVWSHVLDSVPYFPGELRTCFHSFRTQLIQLGRTDLGDHLISASIFLRFLCPAVLSPSLFGITAEYPSEKCSRNLTLVAKVLQTLANFNRFQGKESFMEFMNDFLEKEAETMKKFLQQISTPLVSEKQRNAFDMSIDAGKHLSCLHTLLTDALPTIRSNALGDVRLEHLELCLSNIAALLRQSSDALSTRVSGFNSLSCTAPNRFNEASDRYQYQSLQRSLPRYHETGTVSDHLRNLYEEQRASTLPRPAMSPVKGPESSHPTLDFPDGLRYVDDSPDYEPDKGSNISISQLSNIASSGYQSINSSSPVDQGIHGESSLLNSLNNNNHSKGRRSLSRHPVAFTNPVYQFGIGETFGRSISSRSGLAVHSVEDIRAQRLHTVPNLNLRVPGSTSSSESASCISTPPTERRSFKPSAPRTNPRVVYSGIHMNTPHQVYPSNPDLDTYPLTRCNLNRRKQRLARRLTTEPSISGTIPNTSVFGKLSRCRLGDSMAKEEWDSDDSSLEEHLIERVPRSSLIHRGSRQALDRKGYLTPSEPSGATTNYEQEILELRGAMEELDSRLSRAEKLYVSNPGSSFPLSSVNSTTADNEIRDEHLKAMINRLVILENELQKEKQQMADKQQVIEAQVQTIKALDAANSRLLGALAQLRDRGQASSSVSEVKELQTTDRNSDLAPLSTITQRILADFGDMQSSSC